jgi:hypothetical protein
MSSTVPASVPSEVAWIHRHLLPWLWRHAQGQSSGDGITPKQPRLASIEG